MAAVLCPVGAFLFLCVIVSTASMRVDEKDANEFASFVGWYTFLLACGALLVACTYQRRRQNARELRENLALIERSMAEIARRRGEEGSFAASGAGGREGIGGGLNLNLNLNAPGNQDREWEFIEGLFACGGGGGENEGPTTPWGGDPDFASYVDLQRWMTTNTIGLTRAYRILAYVEKEQGRRRALGRRLVATLKRCSLKVEERHLIAGVSAGGSSGDDDVCVLGRTEEGEAGGGGRRVDHRNADDDGGHDECDGDRGVIIERCNWKSRMESERVDQGVVSSRSDAGSIVGDDAVDAMPTSTESTVVVVVAVVADIGVVESQTLDEMNTNVVLRNDDGGYKTSTSPLSAHSEATLAAASGSTSTSDPTNPPSLHRACDIPAAADVADEDDDSKYSALCVPDIAIPCNNNNDGTSATRAVPPTCAICLLQYRPGNYVAWSSNKECRHVFHRDCILMWLLKKECGGDRIGGDGGDGRWRGLCPCCRGEFVSVSLLPEVADANNVNNDGRVGNDDHTTMEEGGVRINEDNATATTTAGAPQADPLPPPQARVSDALQLRSGVALQLRPSVQQLRLQLRQQQ